MPLLLLLLLLRCFVVMVEMEVVAVIAGVCDGWCLQWEWWVCVARQLIFCCRNVRTETATVSA